MEGNCKANKHGYRTKTQLHSVSVPPLFSVSDVEAVAALLKRFLGLEELQQRKQQEEEAEYGGEEEEEEDSLDNSSDSDDEEDEL